MKSFLTISGILISLLLFSFAKPNNNSGIIGKWKCNEMDNSEIYIWKSQKTGQYFGKIIESDNVSYRGKIILQNVTFSDSNKKGEGTLSHPDKGEIHIKLSASNDLKKLNIEGSKFFITKSFIWYKVK